MLGIILTGHGSFASGLEQAVIQIAGKHELFIAIDFSDGMSTEELEHKLHHALKQVDNECQGIIFLTDIIGGTPFNTTSQIAITHPNAEVITGTNLPLLLEMLLCREGLDIDSFRDMALNAGQNGITCLSAQIRKKDGSPLQSEIENDDGI